MPKYTINDIAREAGVSKATVSRVINRPEAVETSTRERVEDVIRARKYIPSATARNLSLQKSDSIAIVVPELDNPFFGGLTRSATEELDRNDLTVVFFNTDNNPKKDHKALILLKSLRPAGILYTPASDYAGPEASREINELLRGLETPIVIMDRPTPSLESFDGVFFDDYRGIYDATVRLIKTGHNSIALINGPISMVHTRIRLQGYKDALKDHGIPYDSSLCYLGEYKEEDGYHMGNLIFEQHQSDLPSGVIACNNLLSLGFLRAAFEHHVQISKDIDFIGLDRIPSLEVLTHGFNYIEREPVLIGQEAVRLLKKRMDNPDTDRNRVILKAPVIINDLRNLSQP